MGTNAVRAVPIAGTAREAIRGGSRGARAMSVSREQRQIATAFVPSNATHDGRAIGRTVDGIVGNLT